MNKSLNQAFIRAYSKEKEVAANRKAQAQKSNLGGLPDDFIVRFDTATCVIPAPHLSTQKRATAPNLVTADAKPAPVTVQRAAVKPVVAEDIRDSIASQMARSVLWGEPQIDAFSGGFPMISPFHQPQLGQRFGNRPVQGRDAIVAASLRDSQRNEEPNPTEPVKRVPLDQPANLPSGPKPAAQDTRTNDQPASSVQPVLADEKSQPPATSHSPSLIAPEMPALFDSLPSQAPLHKRRVSNEERIQSRGGQGEIFRLDRPSYSGGPPAAEEDAYSDSGEQSSILEVLQSSPLGERYEPPTRAAVASTKPFSETRFSAVPKPAGKSTIERTKSVEANLRKARVRIFNPVWEVDSFQWPEVCLELLAQRADSMNKVAQNLISACQEGLQVLAITSPQSGEGRTTVACCLAKLAGGRGLNVAIVDGDIENPTLSYQTNLDVEQDWKTALINQLPLEEIAVHSIDDQVTLLPLVSPIDQQEMSIDDNRIAYMLQELSESFDLVIVDMGHMASPRNLVTSLSEQGILSAVVAVVDNRCSSPQQIENCLRRIRQTGVASIGLVENFAA